jgi:hypothetical protein
MPPAPVRHEDNLDAVAESGIAGRPKDLFQLLLLSVW